jgi:hypothetical protein
MKRKAAPPKKAARRKQLSAPVIQDLRVLADQIGKIIPATSFRKGGFRFQTIAKNMGMSKYMAV